MQDRVSDSKKLINCDEDFRTSLIVILMLNITKLHVVFVGVMTNIYEWTVANWKLLPNNI